MVDLRHPDNRAVLDHLHHDRPASAAWAEWDSLPDPYYQGGCHPDVVQRLWDQIGRALPKNGRCLIHGTPALVHARAGIILAVGLGTQYALRLPGRLAADAVAAGARTRVAWSSGGWLDLPAAWGRDWVLGTWRPEELDWCCQAYAGLVPPGR